MKEARLRDGWSAAGTSSEELPAGWELATAPDGRQYYFAPGPGLTQWNRPLEPANTEESLSRHSNGAGQRPFLSQPAEQPRGETRPPGLLQRLLPCCTTGTPELMVEHEGHDLERRSSGDAGVGGPAPARNQA
jgi:hypothetical protein